MKNNRRFITVGIAGLLVVFIYVGFIGSGPWRARGYTSDYYSRLASSFQRGQLSLEARPDPALLALPDPYDLKARKGIAVLGDASLYKGKYYLYFGPFPSLILAFIASVFPVETGDQLFVYLFTVGIFFVQSLLFMAIFRQFFAGLPGWILPLGVLVLGLTGPFTRMLTHPFIHEAAISGGQFLFVTGYYFAFLALSKKPIDHGRLLIASILWACSIATRVTLLLPVGLTVITVWLFVWKASRAAQEPGRFRDATLSILAPLFLCGVVLAWYNWARFDSIFEFGFYYQLAGFNLQANYASVSSPVYILQNMYNYYLTPFELSSSFPFAYPIAGSEDPVFSFYELPRLYAVEGKFAGLLYSTPFFIFAAVPLAALITRFRSAPGIRIANGERYDLLDWTLISLITSFVGGSIPILSLFYVGFRYEAEFVTSLSMLALIGFCLAYQLTRNTTAKKLLSMTGITLAVFSVVVSTVLAFTGRAG